MFAIDINLYIFLNMFTSYEDEWEFLGGVTFGKVTCLWNVIVSVLLTAYTFFLKSFIHYAVSNVTTKFSRALRVSFKTSWQAY